MSTPPIYTVTSSDIQATEKAFGEYRDWHTSFLDRINDQVGKAIDVTKQLSTFHERLLLICLGTIGFSVTAITTLGSSTKFAGSNFPRHTVTCYVIPAWISLLLCIIISNGIMRQVVELNRSILEQWYQLTSQFTFNVGTTALTRLSTTIRGTVAVGTETKDVSEHMRSLAAQLKALADKAKPDQFEKLLKIAWGKDKTLNHYSSVAVVLFIAGVALLGIAAVKIILSF
jgi:hypothetical protein